MKGRVQQEEEPGMPSVSNVSSGRVPPPKRPDWVAQPLIFIHAIDATYQ